MATGGVNMEEAIDKNNPHRLLLQLVRNVLQKKADEDVTVQYQYALRLISSNFTPTVDGDDFQVAERIKKKLAHQNRVEDAAKFSELYTKLKSKMEVKNKWAILYVLMTLAEDKRPGRNTTLNKTGVFWQGLPRMATSTPFPGIRPMSHENTGDSSDPSGGITRLQLSEHTHSSGIGSGVSSISGTTGSSFRHQYMTGYLNTPGLTPAVSHHRGVTFADDTRNHTTGTRLAQMLLTDSRGKSMIHSAAPSHSRVYHETDDGGSEVAEHLLVRDLLYVFQGIDGQLVKFSHIDDAFHIDPQVSVSKPTRDLTHKLSELGWLYLKVRKYVENRSQDKALGVIVQSFCAALQQELTEYYRLLAVLQAQQEHETDPAVVVEPSDTLSLIRLKVWTYDPAQRMKYLAILVDGCKDKKNGALCSSIESYTMRGDPAVRSLMKYILKVVAMPMRSMLDKWIYEGELEDKYHEFFVASDPTVREEKLWHEKYSLRKSMIPSFIRMEQARQILSIGKSINFLRHVCKNNEPVKGQNDDIDSSNTTERNTEMLLEQDLDSSFQHVIDTVYQETSKRLLHVLHQDFKFLEHLKAMRRYLLLGQGDFIQHLLDLLESDLAKPASSLYLHNLTGVLETAIRATNAQYDDKDILHRLDVRLLQISPGDTGWDVFSLDYHVDGPISTVFTPQCKLLYLRVFNFLWRAKRMDYVLNQVWRGQMANAKALKDILELAPILHQCHILAAQMIHFVQQMQYYINFEVMECSWDELWKKVTAAEDLDHIIAAHEVFLDTIIRRALLDYQSRPLLTQLRAIFDLIIQFQSTQEGFFTSSLEELALRQAHQKDIEVKSQQGEWGLSQHDEEDQRRRRAKFLREVIPTNRAQLKVLAKSYQDMVQQILISLTEHSDASLRLLAVRLDFNEVYKAKKPRLRSPMAYNKTRKIF